jgi:hypothetical protein
MGGQEPNRTATMSTAPSVAELQRENIVLELECIDRIYLNAFVPQLTSEKGIAGYYREFMGHRFASTKSAGKSRSCRAPERRRRNAQSGIQRPALLLAPCFAPRVWPRRAFGSVSESCLVLTTSQLLDEICSCFAVEITRLGRRFGSCPRADIAFPQGALGPQKCVATAKRGGPIRRMPVAF